MIGRKYDLSSGLNKGSGLLNVTSRGDFLSNSVAPFTIVRHKLENGVRELELDSQSPDQVTFGQHDSLSTAGDKLLFRQIVLPPKICCSEDILRFLFHLAVLVRVHRP